jgi:hypothetical protein
MKAFGQFADFHSLLVLFADSGVDFPSELEIEYDCNLCSVFINASDFYEKVIDMPFRIRYWRVKDKFQEICANYKALYEENLSLFHTYFEIIRGHSGKINRFLDLARIIESYSRKNRKSEVKRTCHVFNTNCKRKTANVKDCETCKCKNEISQKIRYIDIFTGFGGNLTKDTYLPDIFMDTKPTEIDNTKILDVCENITALRNYHTHYYDMPQELKDLYKAEG